MGDHDLYLGSALERSERIHLDMDHLTTHAICLGMTGSGKTGLGIVALEELARQGVSLLVLDLKGDMVDLLLNFPSLDGADFEPWLPPDAGEIGERSTVAREQVELWRNGLAGSGLGSKEMNEVRSGVDWRLLTPGAGSGAPLDILPTLGVPDGWNPEGDQDSATDRVNGVTSALLSLVGRGGDPLTDRDHVFTASVILDNWRRGKSLDLAGLLTGLMDPPFQSLGALPLESFFPRDHRMKLVTSLNTLLARPAFAAWTEGVPLDMEHLLGNPSMPRATIVSVAHLEERQRLFVIALLVSELVSWMRRQPASSGLRALLYMDEVQGILPPYPSNPPTKSPLLTLFKQGRAYGVGAWLATQNPVDLDYKALGNAGVKLIGRLITDRDRERALEGLAISSSADGRDVDQVVASLGKRQFVLEDVRAKERVRTFSSRWAMSYLRGPVTLAEMTPLFRDDTPPRSSSPEPGTEKEVRTQPPPLEAFVRTGFLADGEGLASPALLIHNRLSVHRSTLKLNREMEEIWLVPTADDGRIEWESAERPHEIPELQDEAPEHMSFPRAAPPRLRRPLEVTVNTALKLVAEEDEDPEAFLDRCLEAADEADDATQDKIRRRYEGRMQTLRKRLGREQDELERDLTQLKSRKAEETMGMVESLFSVLLGSKSVRSASRKAAAKLKTATGKRRIRQTAEGAVRESENEIERIESELEDLADEMQDEVDRIAAESEEKAEAVEVVAVKAKKADIEVLDLRLFWG
jgi:hypothetical protein